VVKKNLYSLVYNFIKENGKLPKSITKQKAYYYTKSMVREGLIEHIEHGVWKVLREFDGTNVVKVTTRSTRGHGFVFRVSFPSLEGWNKREQFLKAKEILYTELKQGQRIIVLGNKVQLYDNCLMIYFSPNTYFQENSPNESSYRAMMYCKDILKRLEKMLNCSFRSGRGWIVQETRSHYADINNVCARYYKSKGIDYVPIVLDGKNWALIDNSMNLYELETILGSGQSKDDMNTLQDFLNDLKTNPSTLGEVKKEVTDKINTLTKILEMQMQQSLENQKQMQVTNMQLATFMNEVKKRI